METIKCRFHRVLLLLLASAATVHALFNSTSWMGEINSGTMLQDVLLPGSHNAGAYQLLHTDSTTNPDYCGGTTSDLEGIDESMFRLLVHLERTGKLNLIQTQRKSIRDQLELGIRYLDLRLGWTRGDIYLHHTLFMNVTFSQVLDDTAAFLARYDSEVVILKLRLQCGAPLEVALDLLESKLGNYYGGLLTSELLSSTIGQLQGLAFTILDETDTETAKQASNSLRQAIKPDEYYRIFPCLEEQEEDAIDTCWLWPTYSQSQGESLLQAITADSSENNASNQLTDWKPTTIPAAFRILSWLGVIPIGKGCDPSGIVPGLAILSCPRVGIDDYTESFQDNFMEMLDTLEENQMIDAINVIQLDYVDGYPIEAIVQYNQIFCVQFNKQCDGGG